MKLKQLGINKSCCFFIKFDKNFVWTKYFFHTYGFLSLEGPLLAGLCSRKPGPVSRACSKVKKPYVWKKYFVQTNFLSNLVKKSTTFINTKLLQFHTLPTLSYRGSPLIAVSSIADSFILFCPQTGVFFSKTSLVFLPIFYPAITSGGSKHFSFFLILP